MSWGAFFRGAAGPGLIDLSQRLDRRDELEQSRLYREEERNDDRAWREEQARLDREARAELAAGRASGGSGSRGKGALSAMDPDAERAAVVFRIMRDQGVSRPEAEKLLDSSETGENPYTRDEQVPEQIDDGDRMRTVSTSKVKPDVEKFKKLMAQIGGYRADLPMESESNIDQVQKSRTEAWQRQTGQDAQANPSRAGALAVGPAAAAGKPIYNEGDNLYTGETGAKTQAETKAAGALVTQRNAAAAKDGAEINKIKAELDGDLKKQTPEKLTTTLNAVNGLIRTYDENSMDEGAKAARAELQTMARQIANELSRRGLGGKPDAGGGPTLKGLPPGAKQIGTSKGKPVYQTPDGKRFIGD